MKKYIIKIMAVLFIPILFLGSILSYILQKCIFETLDAIFEQVDDWMDDFRRWRK